MGDGGPQCNKTVIGAVFCPAESVICHKQVFKFSAGTIHGFSCLIKKCVSNSQWEYMLKTVCILPYSILKDVIEKE